MSIELEFDDVKKLRKSLLVASAVGIFLAKLVKFSTGTIEFFGFSLPIKEASFLPNYIGYLIVFFIIALLIRYNEESFKNTYGERLKEFEKFKNTKISEFSKIIEVKEKISSTSNKTNDIVMKEIFLPDIKNRIIYTKYSVFILDIIFPIVLGMIALVIIFFKL